MIINIRIYKIIILPVVLYGRETWSLILREEHKLRMFDNRMPKRIFRPKRDEEKRELGTLPNEELHDLYSSVCILLQVHLMLSIRRG
jgi:hypothetical protein